MIVSVDVESFGSNGRHSIGSSALPFAGTTSVAGTTTSALLAAAVNDTSVSSGLTSGSACWQSWRSGACSSIVCSVPGASALSSSL